MIKINVGKKVIKDLKKISKFTSEKKDNREYLENICFKNNQFKATNGKIAIIIDYVLEAERLDKETEYKVIILDNENIILEKSNIKFPDITKIIPAKIDMTEFCTFNNNCTNKQIDTNISKILSNTDMVINFRFLLLFPIATNFYTFYISKNKDTYKNKAMLFEGNINTGKTTIIVMPINDTEGNETIQSQVIQMLKEYSTKKDLLVENDKKIFELKKLKLELTEKIINKIGVTK